MINLLIVHEIRLMCNVIASVLEGEEDITVSGYATGVEEALEKVKKGPVDVVLVSTHLPGQGALQLTQSLAQTVPDVSVLALGLSEYKEDVLQFIEAGAFGYVLKNDSVAKLLSVIRSAYAGRAQVSPEIAAALINRVSELSQKFSDLNPDLLNQEQLTPREMEVLQLLGQNLSNQQISEMLMVEIGTVKNHVHNILSKLNVSTRQEAALYLAVIEKQPRGDGIGRA